VLYAYFKKQIVPLSEAKVSIMTHALHYGTAVFEGIRGNWNEQKNSYIFSEWKTTTRECVRVLSSY